jgi:hypothetical protein
MAATALLWIVVALLTPPESDDRLIGFYRRARPMGFWGPIARKAGLPAPGGGPIARGLAIAGAGATMVGAGVIAVSMMYVARWDVAAAAGAASAIAGWYFKRTFGPFVTAFDRERGDA